MLKKIGVLGHFGEGKNLLNGQTVKTRIVTEALQKAFGEGEVLKFDTHGGKKTLLKAPFQVLAALKKARNVVIFPAHNGLRVYAPLLAFFRRFFKRRTLHYAVIGGWLPEFLKGRRHLLRALSRFDGIYVETATMKRAMEELGFRNIFVMPNCKELTVLAKEELIYAKEEPYKLCTFSRVMKQKGIEDAIEAVKAVNENAGRTVYSLDIYGQIDSNEAAWFTSLQETFPPYVRYGGLVPFDQSVEALKGYFALLFPTRFYTEGIPGTILDAYAAGIPVISARWESFADIVEEGVCGIGYEFGSQEALLAVLRDPASLYEWVKGAKIRCLQEAERFRPTAVIGVLLDNLQ